jgi:hypothetical protein
MYGRQLHAYALALEHPADGALALSPISRLGLIYFTPDSCAHPGPLRQALEGNLKWIEVLRDDAAFMGFLESVVLLLDGPMPPLEPASCGWCDFRTRLGGQTELKPTGTSPEAMPSVPMCPVCGGPMRLRTGKHGEFWSCIGYPNCRGTRNA